MAAEAEDYAAIRTRDEEGLLHFLNVLCLTDPNGVGRDPLMKVMDHEEITTMSRLASMTGGQIGELSYLQTPGVDTSIRGIPHRRIGFDVHLHCNRPTPTSTTDPYSGKN